ncbi:MAG: TMEM175 family protein [Phycisphaerales bacterium]
MRRMSTTGEASRRRDLSNLPTNHGFRLRGVEMTRIETFTDAAFAFALTLLVISFEVPTRFDELVRRLYDIPAFAMSFALLMIFWYGHHVWSRRYGLDDLTTVFLSCVLVFTVLVYVYPLKFLAGSFFVWFAYLTGMTIPPNAPRIDADELNPMFIVYGIGFVSMSTTLVLLYAHAWRRRVELELNELERYITKCEVVSWLIVIGVGLLSITLALAVPANMFGVPGWAYALLAIVMPIFGVVTDRRIRALRESGAA